MFLYSGHEPYKKWISHDSESCHWALQVPLGGHHGQPRSMRRLCGIDLAETRVSESSLHRDVSLRQAERALPGLPPLLHLAYSTASFRWIIKFHWLGVLSSFSMAVAILSLAYLAANIFR